MPDSKIANRFWLGYGVAFFFALQILLWFVLGGKYQHYILDRPGKVDLEIRNSLETKRPDILLLGNSFLGAGVDEERLEQDLGIKVLKEALPGTTTPTWYLILKNVVSQSEWKPSVVIIFFVDSHLTWPDYNLDATHNLVTRYAETDEPLIDERLYDERNGPIIQLATRLFPTYRFRHQLSSSLNNTTKYYLGNFLGFSPETVDSAESYWSSSDYRVDSLQDQIELAQWPAEHLDFFKELPRSLLDPIIQTAQEQKIQLIFVRLQRRRDIVPDQQSEALQRYIADLSQFIKENGAFFLDFSDMRILSKDDFATGDHLNEHGQFLFTQALAEKLIPILKSLRGN